MMNNIKSILVAGSMMALGVPAAAQAEDKPFDGPWVEGIIGYDAAKAEHVERPDGTVRSSETVSGFAYGVGAGYDYNLGDVTLGVEGEYMDSSADSDFGSNFANGLSSGTIDAKRDYYLGARVGYVVQPDLLIYGKVGYMDGRFKVDAMGDGIRYFSNVDSDGVRLGAGVEYALNNNLFTKFEYRYSNYGSAEIDFEGDIPDEELGPIDLDRHQVMFALGYRF